MEDAPKRRGRPRKDPNDTKKCKYKKTVKHSEGWGGARKGAGQKPQFTGGRKSTNVQLTPDARYICDELKARGVDVGELLHKAMLPLAKTLGIEPPKGDA